MANTALFDSFRATGPITKTDIKEIADTVAITISPDLNTLKSNAASISIKADAVSINSDAAVGKIDQLATELSQVKDVADEILRNVPPAQMGGAQFRRLRKCLQLLNRLEDWDLAEDFHSGAELSSDEYMNLKMECLRDDQNRILLQRVLPELEDHFPKQDDKEARGQYYGRILLARIAIVKMMPDRLADKGTDNSIVEPSESTQGAQQ